MRAAHVSAMRDELFPREVVTVVVTGAPEPPPLLPEEEPCVRQAVAKRRREFAAGRGCARNALAELGITDFPILAGADRAPIWPAGIVGSITHCEGLAGAAVVREDRIAGLGLDAETTTPVDTDLVSTICTPAEQRWAEFRPAPGTCGWEKVIFSAKEAVHKCIWPVYRIMLDFHDVEVATFGGGRLGVRFESTHSDGLPDPACLQGRYVVHGDHILTGFVLWRGVTNEDLLEVSRDVRRRGRAPELCS